MGRAEDVQATTILPQGAVFDWGQAERFLALLGKNKKDARLRAIPHKETDEEVKKRLRVHKFQWDRSEAERYQRDGLGIYLVINNGGDTKASITSCVAYFAEFDGVSEDDQFKKVNDSGLPEPSIVVRTGGGSLHFYWLLDQPFEDPEQWQKDTKRLIAHLGSDKSVNDPSRVMRLPGCSYMGPDQKPRAHVEIVSSTEARYSREEILACLPPESIDAPLLAAAPTTPTAPPATAPGRISMPLDEFISKKHKDLIETGSAKGCNNDEGMELSLDLVGTEGWLISNGATPDPSARVLFEAYLGRSAANYGKGFDRKAAWARFEGAEGKNPSPSTPVDKLEARLSYYRRQAPGASGTAQSGPGTTQQQPKEKNQGQPTTKLSPWEQQKQAALADCMDDPVKESAARWNLLMSRADEVIGSDSSISEQRQAIKAVAKSLDLNLSNKEIEDIHRQRDTLSACDEPDVEGGGIFTAQAQSWLLHEVFLNGLNLLVGMPGAGKSLLAAAIARAFLHGQSTFLGRALTDGSKQKVLLIGTDQDRQQWGSILADLGLATPIEQKRDANGIEIIQYRLHDRIHLKTLGGSFRLDADGLRWIRNWNQANPGGLGIIDALGAVLPPDVKENDEVVGRLIRDLDRCRMGNPGILLHHVNKLQGLNGNAGVYCGSGHGSIDRAVSRVIGLAYETHTQGGIEKLHEESPRRVITSQKRGAANQRLIVEMGPHNTWDYISTAAEDLELKRQDRDGDATDRLKGWKKAIYDTLASADGLITTSAVTAALPHPYACKPHAHKQVQRSLRELADDGVISEDRATIGENRWTCTHT